MRSRERKIPRPRRSPVVFLVNVYCPLTVLGLLLTGLATANRAVAPGLWGVILSSVALVGLFANLRVSSGTLIMRRRLTIAWRRLALSEIPYARVDHPWIDWGAPGGLSGVTLVLKSGEQVPVLESGTRSLDHAEHWLRYIDQVLEQ